MGGPEMMDFCSGSGCWSGRTSGGGWRNVDRWPDGDAKREAHRVFEYLDKIDPAAVGAHQDTAPNVEPGGLPFLRFSDAALEVFLEWRNKLEDRLRSGDLHPAMESHLAKYRKLVPGLALSLQLADCGTGPVSEKAVLQALGWAEHLESHASRAYASVTMTDVPAAKAIIKRFRKGDLPRAFSPPRCVASPMGAAIRPRAGGGRATPVVRP